MSYQERPQKDYREQFRRLIHAENPSSVLEVGSGGGSLLRWMAAAGIAAQGMEVDAAKVATLLERGLQVTLGRGEQLPFGDGSFDLVVSEYCAHHFADLSRHLAEALRVARKAVFLLDPWFDESIVSQRRTLRWDRWFKAIDRREGMVHHDVVTAAGFLLALPPAPAVLVDFQHWLHLQPVDMAWFDEETAPHLAKANPDEAAELATIRADAMAEGMTDDGAIVVRLRK